MRPINTRAPARSFRVVGTRCFSLLLFTLLLSAYATAAPTSSSPLAEMELIAIDLGHESMKISAWRTQEEDVYIKPGGTGTVTTTTAATTGAVSMVLNDQTNRKSPPCVAFRYFKAPAGSVVGEGGHSSKKETDAVVGGNQLYPPGYQLERSFAEQAQALAARFPTQVVCGPAQLLGYTMVNTTIAAAGTAATSPHHLTEDQLTAAYSFHVKPIHQQQQQQQGVLGNEKRGALGVIVPFFSTTTDSANSGSFFTAEELTAMLLGYARRMAEKADAADNALSEEDERQLMDLFNSTTVSGRKGQPLRGHAVPRYAALTIPVHASVAQRQALVDAAALAGLRIVRLVHSTTGAAVQLAHMKVEQVFLPDKTQYIMMYDMGSQQAEVAVYGFTPVPSTVAKRVRYRGYVELKALVGSRTLGGAAFDECIAAQWDALYFANTILSGVGRATTEAERRAAAKERGSLLRAAHKAKEMLSANQEAHITMDGVHADLARFSSAAQTQLQQHVVSVVAGGLLSLRYTRRVFEQECKALFDAAVTLRDDAIAAMNGVVANVGALDRFEVIGGGTRIPLLLQRLSEGYRADGSLVDRTLNSDEAAVLGTTLLSVSTAPHALQLRGGQSIPQYRVREWLTNAVYVSITSNSRSEDNQMGKDAKAVVEPAEGGDTAYLRLLFAAHTTIAPATRSVRVRLCTDCEQTVHSDPQGKDKSTAVGDSVSLTLHSGTETDEAYQKRASAAAAAAAAHNNVSVNPVDLVVAVPTSAAACSSCYVRPYVVHGVAKAKETLKAQVQRQYPGGTTVLDSAEVVVEAVATVSGIPHCTLAYLRAVYRVTPTSTTTTTLESAAVTNSPRREDVGERNENTNKEDAPEAATVKATPAEDGEDTEGEEDQTDTHTQPTTTTITATDAQKTSDIFEVKVMALPLRHAASTITTSGGGTSSSLGGYNMGRAELLRSHDRVRRLQAMDDVRLQRSTLRNDIESALVWVKEQPAWGAAEPAEGKETSTTPGPAETSWRVRVTEIEEWLDDHGETADVAALEEYLVAIRAVKRTLRAKQSN